MATPARKRKIVQPSPVTPEAEILQTASPLVFISHDTRDADLAEAFSVLLTDASGGMLQFFRSSDRKGTAGIEFGAEWYSAIMSKLSDATDVVALLTPHSLDRPWILYEAGVAKGKLDATVLGLALNIPLENTNNGPFAQFQNCADDEDSLTKLVMQLICRNPLAKPREEAVRRQVRAFQESVKTVTKNRGKTTNIIPKIDENVVAKMFEEVKILVRDLPMRLPSVGNEYPPDKRRSRKRFHPMMVEEMLHLSMRRGKKEYSSAALLLVLSSFRETQPWLYELGTQFYTAVLEGNVPRMERIRREILSIEDLLRHSPLREAIIYSKEDEEALYSFRFFVDCLEGFKPRSHKSDEPERPSSEVG